MKQERTFWDWWCDRAWIIFGCYITALMTVLILWNWEAWPVDLKLIAAVAALIPIHVVEEWVFPGGFHYQYNTVLYRSEQPERYPMCRLSDMYTNLVATFFFMALTFYGMANGNYVKTGVLMGMIYS